MLNVRTVLILGIVGVSYGNLFSQKWSLGLESGLSFNMPRKVDYYLERRFIQIYSDANRSLYYLYKEEEFGYDLGVCSQIKLLKYWNLFCRLKYAQTVFTGWHKMDSKLINTSQGEDKIFSFELDKYKIHQVRLSVGINCHFNNKVYFQFSPMLSVPFSVSVYRSIGEYALKFTPPEEYFKSKVKNNELNLRKLALAYEAEVSFKLCPKLFLFCNYTWIKDLYRENSDYNIPWGMKSYIGGLRLFLIKTGKSKI